MYVEGEIADLVRIGRPRIGVVTAVQPVHLVPDRLDRGDRAGEGSARRGTARRPGRRSSTSTTSGSGRMADRTAARVVGYGFAEDADVRAEAVESLGSDGMRFELRTPTGRRTVRIPGLGRHAVHNALAAAAVGGAAGIDLDRDRRGSRRPDPRRATAASSSVSAT